MESFADRQEAGKQLSRRLKDLSQEDLVILALPRGGVPIAFEIARSLDAPMDVVLVRKVGHPQNREFGIGAVTEEGTVWINPDALRHFGLSIDKLQPHIDRELQELRRRLELYRPGRPLPEMRNKTVLLVDDGLATGVTARTVARLVKSKGARKVVLAVPVCSSQTVEILREELDDVICLSETDTLVAVGNWYQDFHQVSDAEVLGLLKGTPRP